MDNHNERFVVSPYWSVASVFIVLFAAAIGCWVWCYPEGQIWQIIIMGIMMGWGVLSFSKGYSLDREGIQAKLFGCIVVRRIPWRYVGKVYIFRKWKVRSGKYRGRVYNEGYVVLTMKLGVPFVLGSDDPSAYCFYHPIDSVGFRFPLKRMEEYIAGIRRFYPDAEIVADDGI